MPVVVTGTRSENRIDGVRGSQDPRPPSIRFVPDYRSG
ncbi:hypothetical protein FRUB_01218 [Fimbriiglobus ruber]|uniref:Uncharacterized protein n=1 Tax=Fimbriiglobus ruber TaxID=1908690 RepID=A0A225EE00_9BACT|nr:hypothetical protein FRUB_01218 [Fimbriiglobus ruber]